MYGILTPSTKKTEACIEDVQGQWFWDEEMAALKRDCRKENSRAKGRWEKPMANPNGSRQPMARHRLTLTCGRPTMPTPELQAMQIVNVVGGDVIQRAPIT
jgi:hypothetical protein